ncbi:MULTISPECIES: S41 family peptidase [unclassified Pseudonocardia]|uniref:S41 family peptidase n=1 Tax=unclassified Pseudonocardia TaxID=2619320 RepID=UPI00094ACE39|nr:S41 family peptidase [Pseudonocardia sp. Ae707_Ps1]OLM16420.1 putative protease [Pseudonocardia sp. Ae707_Ps1]
MPAFLRHPHLHDDTLVLVAEDDVWTAPVAGGRAYRLTADEVPVTAPRISPDGAAVAWTSRRDGMWEVYRTALDGGGVTRLTWWGDASTRAAGWTPEGGVVALSAHDEATARSRAYAVPATGGTPRLLPYGSLTAVAFQPGGPAVLTQVEGGRDAAHWKRYRGGRAGRLWLDAGGTGDFVRVLAGLDGQLESPMVVDTPGGARLAFVSDHEGWGNVYSVPLADPGSDLRRHTDHGAGGAVPDFYARHASTDGRRVVYECAGEIFLLDGLDAGSRPRRIDVRLGGPRSARDPFRASIPGDLGPVRPDRSGRAGVVGVRGTVHRLTHRDGPARALLAEPGVRARLAHPLGDDRAVWVDDAEGEDAVCVAPLDPHAPGAPERVRYAAGGLGRVLELAPSPDGGAVALTTHDGRLLVLHTGVPASGAENPDGVVDGAAGDGATAVPERAAGELRELARGAAGEPFDVVWSPDSSWLAWCDPTEAGLSRVVLTRLDDGGHTEVTHGRFHDSDPAFTADGKHLAFLSRRVFDPSYDQHSFDLTFGTGWKPFLVPLAARTPSPFGESPDGRPVDPGDEGPEDPPATPPDPAGGGEDDGGTDRAAATDATATAAPAAAAPATAGAGRRRGDDGPPEVVVDVAGLADRVVGIPVEAARYHGLTAISGGLVWLRLPGGGVLGDSLPDPDDERERAVLERYDLARRSVTVIADPASGFAVSGDGKRIVVRDRGKVRLLRADRSGSSAPDDGAGDEFEIDTSRLVVTVDPSAEWRQMFDETARLMRDHFWVEDMAGVDWAAEVARYRPLVDRLGSHDDLVDLLWELHGELGTSHAYVIGGRPAGDPTGRPGLLGADLEPAGDGWRITRVLPPETSAPAARSPLSAPGVDVRAGDVLLEVGGAPVDPHWGPAPLLVSAAGRTVELTVRSGPGRDDAGTVRRVAVRPLRSDAELRYQDRVARLRAEVDERSGGRLGYLHVPDMMGYGWAQLHRDLARETARDGLVLDVRGNRGGHTSQLVVEKLARTVIGWDLPRHRAPSTYPEQAPRGPVVALADERSDSDGDIVTAAIKRLGIGPVVGVRTWGGVIGIDGRYGLVDGTRITQPRYATWFDDTGWGMENHGVDPDIEVVVTPQDRAAGRDPQLDRAIELALQRLDEHPPARPPDVATRPSMARPALPGRPGS